MSAYPTLPNFSTLSVPTSGTITDPSSRFAVYSFHRRVRARSSGDQQARRSVGLGSGRSSRDEVNGQPLPPLKPQPSTPTPPPPFPTHHVWTLDCRHAEGQARGYLEQESLVVRCRMRAFAHPLLVLDIPPHYNDLLPPPAISTRVGLRTESTFDMELFGHTGEGWGVRRAGACASGVGKRESENVSEKKEIMMRDKGKTGRRKEMEETSEAERQRESKKKRERKKENEFTPRGSSLPIPLRPQLPLHLTPHGVLHHGLVGLLDRLDRETL